MAAGGLHRAHLQGANKAVFLDRDGVLNRCRVIEGKPYPPHHLLDFELLPGVLDACVYLRSSGFLLIVVTNQPDIARGTQTLQGVRRIHRVLAQELPVHQILMCPHDDADGCDCRKPKPGMLFSAAAQHGIDLKQSFMVGDRWKDIEAGRQAGCTTVWIDSGYDEARPADPDLTAKSLSDAVFWMVKTAQELKREGVS